MIRNYNGPKDRRMVIELRTLCDVKAENLKSLSEELEKKGVVSFYTFDKISITVKSEEEIKDFLQKTFLEEIERYITIEETKVNNFFILMLLKLLKKNGGVFPDSKKMEKIEKEAEKLRLAATLKEKKKTVEPIQLLLTEILDFSEEIMELRREKNPDEITHLPYEDELYIETTDFNGKICWDRENGNYHFVTSSITGGTMIIEESEGEAVVYKRCYSGFNKTIRMNQKEKTNLKKIHYELSLLAEEEGLKFKSEADYDMI